MNLTVELLEKELEGLKNQREQIIAKVNQVSGAITMTENLINKMKEPEVKEEVKKGK